MKNLISFYTWKKEKKKQIQKKTTTKQNRHRRTSLEMLNCFSWESGRESTLARLVTAFLVNICSEKKKEIKYWYATDTDEKKNKTKQKTEDLGNELAHMWFDKHAGKRGKFCISFKSNRLWRCSYLAAGNNLSFFYKVNLTIYWLI